MAKHTRLFRHQPASSELLPLIEAWFQEEAGQRLLAAEQQILAQQLRGCFGYQSLQLSISGQISLFGDSAIPINYRAHPVAFPGMALGGRDVMCDYQALPFETDSLDAVILHHAHEFTDNPHDVLREMQRVIRPRGRLLIAGFNPWSWLALSSLFLRLQQDSPWHQHMLSAGRLQDWLGLLGFDILSLDYVFARTWPNFEHGALARWEQCLLHNIHRTPFGACYIISAIKNVSTLTPSKPRWASVVKPFAGLNPANPASPKEVA